MNEGHRRQSQVWVRASNDVPFNDVPFNDVPFNDVPFREPIMGLCMRFLTAAVLVAGMGIAPAAHAQHRSNYHHGGGNNYHHGGGNAAGAAIIGGIIGLGVGAAIASRGYYAPPPPVYYGY